MKLNTENCIICKSVQDYLDIVLNSSSESELFFRGESKQHRNIVPNLYLNEALTKTSSEKYYRSLLCQLGRDEYNDNVTLFRTISEFQHYEAKTRLLDITTNPLVALYFAVEKFYGESVPDVKDANYPCETGMVYLFNSVPEHTKYDTGHTVAIKSALNLIPQNIIDDFLSSCEKYKKSWGGAWYSLKWHSLDGVLRRLDLTSKTLMKLDDDDIDNIWRFMEMLNQKAKTKERLIFPFEIYDDLCSAHIVIPSKCTDRIKQQQGAFIFPKYVNCGKKSMEQIQHEIDESVSSLSAKVKTPDKKKEIIAIKIPGKKKEEIQKDLTKLGITEGFIYPEIKHRSNALIKALK